MESLSCDPNQLVMKEKSQIQLKEEANRDEYPIIWYDPDIDSEDKKAFKSLIQENNEIELFSKFEEVFKNAQSLGSFLLITPTEVDEEKLLQDFKDLQDTYGRRYFDFEEEAVLKSLFKEISEEIVKSLKVYVFCTREDFLKVAPINEEDEEVVIKCDIKEMAQQFREEFTIIWCDPDYDQTERYRTLINKLDIEENNIYTDFGELLKKLDDYSGLPYHLILSEKTQTELIINGMDNFKGLLRLYIYESPSLIISKEKTRKIKMERTIEELIPRIIEGVRTSLKYRNTFPAFATQFDDWDKSHINKVHYYLRGFINFKNRRQAKEDFVNLAKRIYQSKRLLDFEREYFEYNKEQILRWYAKESPIYKLINNCLRISTADSILYCRFILKDMERAIREEYQKESKTFNGVVYRGAYMTEEEFAKLGRNIGREIEMYGFLSTSRSLKAAKNVLNDDITKKVLITIIIPSLPVPELDKQGFADMGEFSKFSQEEEILFNVRSRFQVLEVGNIQLEDKESRHIVLLYGAQFLRKYMTSGNPTMSVEFKIPLELKCNHCESKENLFASTEETGKTLTICRKCFIANNFVSKDTFLLPIDQNMELLREKSINVKVQGRLVDFGTEAKLAYLKTHRCHECLRSSECFYTWINFKNKNIIFDCAECFKKNRENKKHHLLLVEESTKVFWGCKQERSEEINMGWQTIELERLDEYNGADIFEKAHDNGKCQEFCRAILQSSARKLCREVVKVGSYAHLGKINEKLGEYQKSLEYLLKGLEIRKFIFGDCHPHTATSYSNLGLVYDSLGEYQKALEHHLTALEIGKSIFGESHPHIATSYNNLASVHKSLGEHQKSLEYLLEGLEIRRSVYGESHPNTATSYNNTASVYNSLGEYQKALEYHLKALEIRRSVYGESHSATATSYNNIASVYNSLGEYQKALEYFLKALKIRRSVYGELHPDTAASYNNIASVYNSLGEYQKALESRQKVLNVHKSIY